MQPRQNIISIFSTFLQFEADNFGGWATDAKLRHSMQNCLSLLPTNSSETFWALYWHKRWYQDRDMLPSIPLGHISAYLQEACYWSVRKVTIHLEGTQYKLSDCFQVAIAEVPRILKSCAPEGRASIKTYASSAFKNIIRDVLRRSKEIDLCTDWGLLLKLSRKQFTESIQHAGLSPSEAERYLLAWTCFEDTYLPTNSPKLRHLSPPDRRTWEAITQLYNRQRQQLNAPGLECSAKVLESWLVFCANLARAYLYPSVKSLNTPKVGQDSGEWQDDLPDTKPDSLLAEWIALEEADERETQHGQVSKVLQDALTKLDPAVRELLQLYYQKGLTQQQLAQQLGVQQYTVSRKLSKARETLLLALTRWSQETLHTLPTSNVVKNISTALEEWLQEKML